MNTSHLDALNLRLSNARIRLSNAKTPKERALFAVYVLQIEKEIAGEMKFLGIVAAPQNEMSIDDLAKELGL